MATRLKEQARRSSRGQDAVMAVRGQKRNSLERRLETGKRKEDKTFSSFMLEKNKEDILRHSGRRPVLTAAG